MTGSILYWLFVTIFIVLDCTTFALALNKYQERYGEFLWRYVLIPGSGIYIWWKVRSGYPAK